jgi:hypothetical protein
MKGRPASAGRPCPWGSGAQWATSLLALLLETGDRPGARIELARGEAARVALRPALKQAVLAVPVAAVSPR